MLTSADVTEPVRENELSELVRGAAFGTPVFDLHTHLFPPSHRGFCLSGVHELLTYHYLTTETLQVCGLPPERFFSLPKREQAGVVWEELFRRRSPLSEASRGVLTTLKLLGVAAGPHTPFRELEESAAAKVDEAALLRLAGVERLVMSNNPFDAREWSLFRQEGWDRDRYLAALRLDALFADPDAALDFASAAGCSGTLPFLEARLKESGARYAALSLEEAQLRRLLDHPFFTGTLLPLLAERGLPLALMIGVRRGVNPALRDGGDGMGGRGLEPLAHLLARFPGNRVLATVLGQHDQHELAVLGRKFPNLRVFGCWWFSNQPSLIRETLAMRLDLLGSGFIPQHSDARVTCQLLYKWRHFREILADTMTARYRTLMAAGWPVTADAVRRDLRALLYGNAEEALS